MATFVTIVNRVLRRLREARVSNFNDTDYSTLISDFVNETIEEVQGRYEWNALLDNFTFTTDGTSETYALTSSESDSGRDSNNQLNIVRAYNQTDRYWLQRAPYETINRMKIFSQDSDTLNWWRDAGVDSSDRRLIDFWPDIASKSVVVSTYNPHGDIAANDTQVLLPANVVTLGAYARAVDERGEDVGTSAANAWRLYQIALSDAIVNDTERQVDLENDWRPV